MRTWEHTITVDASVDALNQTVGIGIVIQERSRGRRRGPIVGKVAECHPGVAAGTAEEFAVLRALETAKDRGYSRVKVRSDDNRMRSAVRDDHRRKRLSAGSDLRRKILGLAATFDAVQFAWVPRRKNQLAHKLANQGRSRGAVDAVPGAAASPGGSARRVSHRVPCSRLRAHLAGEPTNGIHDIGF